MPEGAQSERIDCALALIAQGDRNGLKALYDLTSGRLLALFLELGLDRSASEEILHDLYLAVWRIARTQSSLEEPGAIWLLNLARDHVSDWRRMQGEDGATMLCRTGPFVEMFQTGKCNPILKLYFAGATYVDLATASGLAIEHVRQTARFAIVRHGANVRT